MSVSSQISRVQYSCDGTSQVFTIPFYFFLNTDIRVTVTNITTDVTTVLNLNSDYTITGAGSSTGGTVTTAVAYTTGNTLEVGRLSMSLLQNLDLVPNGAIPTQSLEATLDNIVMQIQQLNDFLSAAISIPIDMSENIGTTLPNALSRANMYLGFDEFGNVDVLPGTDDGIQLIQIEDETGSITIDNQIADAPIIHVNYEAAVDNISIQVNPDTGRMFANSAIQNPVEGDIVTTSNTGQALDSGKTFSIDQSMGGSDPTNLLIPTQAAVNFYVKNNIVGIITYMGGWNAEFNSPDLSWQTGVNGDCYLVIQAGQQSGLNKAGNMVQYEKWDAIIYNAAIQSYEQISASDVVLSVNGQRGIVTLTLAELVGTIISNPQAGQVLSYTGSNWVNTTMALANVGDYKYSEQKNDFVAGNGTWLICNGRALQSTQYPNLFNLIGYNYGGASGTFYLPNMVGRVLAMADSDGGYPYATSSGAYAPIMPIPGHSHSATDNGHSHVINDPQHTHTTNAVYTTGGSGYGNGTTSWQNATINKASTGISINTGKTGITNAQGNANITVAQTGTTGQTMSVIQPTLFTRNCFIYAN